MTDGRCKDRIAPHVTSSHGPLFNKCEYTHLAKGVTEFSGANWRLKVSCIVSRKRSLTSRSHPWRYLTKSLHKFHLYNQHFNPTSHGLNHFPSHEPHLRTLQPWRCLTEWLNKGYFRLCPNDSRWEVVETRTGATQRGGSSATGWIDEPGEARSHRTQEDQGLEARSSLRPISTSWRRRSSMWRGGRKQRWSVCWASWPMERWEVPKSTKAATQWERRSAIVANDEPRRSEVGGKSVQTQGSLGHARGGKG